MAAELADLIITTMTGTNLVTDGIRKEVLDSTD